MEVIVMPSVSPDAFDRQIIKQDFTNMSSLLKHRNQLGCRRLIILPIPVRTWLSFFILSDQSDIHLKAIPVASMIRMLRSIGQTYVSNTKFSLVATRPAKCNLLDHRNEFGMRVLAATCVRRSI